MQRHYVNTLHTAATFRVLSFEGIEGTEIGSLPIIQIEDSKDFRSKQANIKPDDVVIIDRAKYNSDGREGVTKVNKPFDTQIEQLLQLLVRAENEVKPENLFIILNESNARDFATFASRIQSDGFRDKVSSVNVLEASPAALEFADELCEKFPAQFQREKPSQAVDTGSEAGVRASPANNLDGEAPVKSG